LCYSYLPLCHPLRITKIIIASTDNHSTFIAVAEQNPFPCAVMVIVDKAAIDLTHCAILRESAIFVTVALGFFNAQIDGLGFMAGH
jgi:hypothetical protein